jgi:hypothetical protein
VPRRGATASLTLKECEPIFKPGQDFRGIEQPNARGGQFDRQRQSIQAATDLSNHVGVAHLEVRVLGTRALDEQADRVGFIKRAEPP